MKLIVSDQWDKLVAMFKSMAGNAAMEKSQDSLGTDPARGGFLGS